jgi:gliding motility-associated-like protein
MNVRVNYISFTLSLLFFLLAGLQTLLAGRPLRNSIVLQLTNHTYCAGNEFVLSFRSEVGANDYVIQLSNENGNFGQPLTIGRASGLANFITCTMQVRIPNQIKPGNRYRMRVVALGPFITGADNGRDIEVRAAPIVKIRAETGTALCDNKEVILVAETSAQKIVWSDGTEASQLVVKQPGLYFATVSDEFSCAAQSEVVRVTSGIIDKPQIRYTGSLELCEGSKVELDVPMQPGLNYQWQKNGRDEGSANSSGLVVTEPGVYRVVVSNLCNEVVSESVLVSLKAVVPPPQVQNISLSRCGAGSVRLQASGGREGNYRWYDSNFRLIQGAFGSVYNTPELSKSTIYYVANESFGCISRRIEIKVEVIPAPEVASRSLKTHRIQIGEKIRLSTAQTGIAYRWEPTAGLDNPSVANPVASPLNNTTYTVVIAQSNGCELTERIQVEVIKNLVVPNGFSPNNDGVNDTWLIANLEYNKLERVEVYDRWGGKVYESDTYLTPWDGTFRGQPLPQGAYFYVIRLADDRKVLNGVVNIIR